MQAGTLTEISEALILAAWKDDTLKIWPDADLLRALLWVDAQNKKTAAAVWSIPLRELGRRVCAGIWKCEGPL